MEKISPAEMIVDLFELRAVSISPQADKYERVTFDYHYHVLSNAISLLIGKYKVGSGEIEDAIRERRDKAKIDKLRSTDYSNNPFETLREMTGGRIIINPWID